MWKNLRRPYWFFEWLLLLLDIIALPEILQLLQRVYVWDQKKLTSREKEIAFPIFQDSIEWDLVRMNGKSHICRKYKIAFVSFHTIHYGDGISDDIFIHELVHVWQYQKYGSAYIVRALHAQRTAEGYNYGGHLNLCEKNNISDFNFEQMAEIVRDGYLAGGRMPIYDKYMKQLLE